MMSLPKQLSLAEAETQRTQDRATERASHEPSNLTEESVNVTGNCQQLLLTPKY